MRLPLWIGCASLLALVCVPPAQATSLQESSRIQILRALLAEYGTVRIVLPAGSKGLRLQSTGQVDQDSLQHEITQNGTALKPGTLVQITQIQFKDKEIVLQINGGGKRSKWYDHVQGGMVTTDAPMPTVADPNSIEEPPPGSSITLAFPGKVPDMTPDELKQYIAPVLDMNAKTLPTQIAPTEAIPPQFEKDVEEKRAAVGMDQDMVRAAMGPPDRKVREEKDGVEQEDWIYQPTPLKVVFVTFEGEKVISIQEYRVGPRGEMQLAPKEPPI